MARSAGTPEGTDQIHRLLLLTSEQYKKDCPNFDAALKGRNESQQPSQLLSLRIYVETRSLEPRYKLEAEVCLTLPGKQFQRTEITEESVR